MPPVKSPPQRRLVDRLRQIALFELGGLLLITPPFMWLSGVGLEHSLGLLASAALVAALWNAAYNIGFDRVEGHLTGRTADRRPWRLRVIHAIGFERHGIRSGFCRFVFNHRHCYRCRGFLAGLDGGGLRR